MDFQKVRLPVGDAPEEQGAGLIDRFDGRAEFLRNLEEEKGVPHARPLRTGHVDVEGDPVLDTAER